MSKKPLIKDEDIFLKAIAGATPLLQKNIKLPLKKTVATIPTAVYQDDISLEEKEILEEVGSEAFITYKQISLSNKILRKLRKGQYNVDAKLDLHGMTVEQAKTAFTHFLKQCLQEGKRVVLIVHGKSRLTKAPILKNKLNHWLRTLHCVLAFCSAAPSHGSRGAVYVYLRRKTGKTE